MCETTRDPVLSNEPSKRLLRAALFLPPVALAHVGGINSSGCEWGSEPCGIFYTAHKIAADVVNLFFAQLLPSFLSFSLFLHPLSFPLLRSCGTVQPRESRLYSASDGKRSRVSLSFFVFLRENPRRTWQSLISKLQAHLGYNAPWGVLWGLLHTPLSPPIWGYAMHYAMPRVSRKVLNRFSRLHFAPILGAPRIGMIAPTKYAIYVYACSVHPILCDIHISYIFLRTFNITEYS